MAAKFTSSKATKVCDVLRVSIIGDAINLYCTASNNTAFFEKIMVQAQKQAIDLEASRPVKNTRRTHHHHLHVRSSGKLI